MRPIFKNPELQSKFDNDGYVVGPLLSQAEIINLLDQFSRLPNVIIAGFFSSLYNKERDYKKRTHDALKQFGEKAIEKYLIDYRILALNFVTKSEGDNSYMPPHQDWTFVDEDNHRSINIWCPLMDVNKENGAIYIFKNGHKIPPTIRGTQTPNIFADVDILNFETLQYLPMKAGEVLIYDHRMIHASPPNKTKNLRIAAAGPAIPIGADPIHFVFDEKQLCLKKYLVSNEFYFDYTFGDGELPENIKLIEQLDNYTFPKFHNNDILPYLKKKTEKTHLLKKLFKW